MKAWIAIGLFFRAPRVAGLLLSLLLLPQLRGAALVNVPELGVRVSPGFRVNLFAGPTMADDITAMTVNMDGNVVVSGPGYVRVLIDEDQNGVAEDMVELLPGSGGASGLAVDGADVYAVTGQGLSRFSDLSGDGVTDPVPFLLQGMQGGERGGHGVRRGLDGWIYLVAGDQSGLDRELAGVTGSPVTRMNGGGLLRLDARGLKTDILAHGFRNPVDFAFNHLGDLFAWDNDNHEDLRLPWYRSPRLYLVEQGGHHGWDAAAHGTGGALPDYDPRVVPSLATLPRGAFTGLVCYRHIQYPLEFRQGLFAGDWALGRIYFIGLQPFGSGYRAFPQLFLEGIGSSGFAPTDLAVGKDGSLLVATGGNKARGGVYRIQYIADPAFVVNATNWSYQAANDLDLVVLSPQPDAAWSRNLWVPRVNTLGAAPFVETLDTETLPLRTRHRALDALVELRTPVPLPVAGRLARSDSAALRSRLAWAIGRLPQEGDWVVLSTLATDVSPHVRRRALAVLGDRAADLAPAVLQQAIGANLGFPDKRVQLGAERLASLLSPAAWTGVWGRRSSLPPVSRLTLAQARMRREEMMQPVDDVVAEALAVLKLTRDPYLRVRALRVLVMGLGGMAGPKTTPAVFHAFELKSPPPDESIANAIIDQAESLLASGHRQVSLESSRLLAALHAGKPGLVKALLSQVTFQSSPNDDLHYLTAISRLHGSDLEEHTGEIVRVLLSLAAKWNAAGTPVSMSWMRSAADVFRELTVLVPELGPALVNHEQFVAPAHLALVSAMSDDLKTAAARAYLKKMTPQFPWSPELVALLSRLPAAEVNPVLRQQWRQNALREQLISPLARQPGVVDRDKFVWGLEAVDLKVARESLGALVPLPRDPAGGHLAPLIRLLMRVMTDPQGHDVRQKIVALINQKEGTRFAITQNPADKAALRQAYQPVIDWFHKTHAALVTKLDPPEAIPHKTWVARVKSVPWSRGNPLRGGVLFRQLNCGYCHEQNSPLGPALSGITDRQDPAALLEAIAYPDREVAPRYRMIQLTMRGGEVHTGMILHESPDHLLFQTAPYQTLRLYTADILQRQLTRRSVMPTALIKDLDRQGLADLYAFLKAANP